MEVAHPDQTQRMTRKVEGDERTLEVIQKGLMVMAVTVLATTIISRMPRICCAGWCDSVQAAVLTLWTGSSIFVVVLAASQRGLEKILHSEAGQL